MDEIINKVSNSGILTIDLEQFQVSGRRVQLDIKDQLFQGLVLREKDFREHIKLTNWAVYKDCFVAITCSADAIVPTWAYMLLSAALEPYAKKVIFGELNEMENVLFEEQLNALDLQLFKDARVVIKGCGEKPIPTNAYVKLTYLLKPWVKSIMYGEPCSTVPIYKAPKS